MTNLRSLELRQKAQSVSRPLKCPLCSFKFAYRHRLRNGGVCPRCQVPLGFPTYYRGILFIASEGVLFASIHIRLHERRPGLASHWLAIWFSCGFHRSSSYFSGVPSQTRTAHCRQHLAEVVMSGRGLR